jgi:hypothetical protein
MALEIGGALQAQEKIILTWPSALADNLASTAHNESCNKGLVITVAATEKRKNDSFERHLTPPPPHLFSHVFESNLVRPKKTDWTISGKRLRRYRAGECEVLETGNGFVNSNYRT